MENKKLINILLKDMEELETLISDMKTIRQYDAIAMELAHNRTRSIMHLLPLLNEQDQKNQPENAVPPQSKSLESTNESETIDHPREIPGQVPGASNKNLLKEEDQAEDADEPAANSEPEIKPGPHTPEEQSEGNDMLEEESLNKDLQVRLIDSFLKGKSVNDLITDQHKLEFKLSNRPVSNIQKAIGINDRFQYIRELFDNDTEKFLQAVKSIDSMHTATEAYQYLRARFKWQKTETSLKFLHLIKRRFSNETSNG